MTKDPGDITLASYQAGAGLYRQHEGCRAPEVERLLVRLATLVPGGNVLEVGGGTGANADRLEELGLEVDRTDATPAFVETQQDGGHDARILDVRRDELGGPFDAILALATLHHLSRVEFERFLVKAGRAVAPRGLLAVTVKEGDGEAWSEAKLGHPRYFVYWRERSLQQALSRCGWEVLSLDHVLGREPWLFALAARPWERPIP